MVSTDMQYDGLSRTYQIARRLLMLTFGICLIIFLSAVGFTNDLYFGPSLFVIYIKDLQECESSSLCMPMIPRLYSICWWLHSSWRRTNKWRNRWGPELATIQKLALNIQKTRYMIIGSRYWLRHLNEDLNIKVDSHQLERAISCRNLEIELDETQGWQCQAGHICKKVSASLPLLLPQTTLQMWGLPNFDLSLTRHKIKIPEGDSLVLHCASLLHMISA